MDVVVRRSEEQANWEIKDSEDRSLVDQQTLKYGALNTNLSIGMLLVAALQAIFFIWQLMLMRKTVADTNASAKAAKLSADAAEKGLHLAERPILRIEPRAVNGVQEGVQSVVTWDLINSGRTHAEILEIRGTFGISSQERIPLVPPEGEPIELPGVIFAGSQMSLHLKLAEPISGAELSDIVAERSFLAFTGKVTVRDEFDWICELGYGVICSFQGGVSKFSFIPRKGFNFVRWYKPGEHPIDTGQRPSVRLPYHLVCEGLAEIEGDRDDSLLRLHVENAKGQKLMIDFHGEQISELQRQVNHCIQVIPGLAAWAGDRKWT